MPHQCENLIIHCLDFRLQDEIYKYLKEEGLRGDCDIISLAGGVHDLVMPEESNDKDYFLRQIDISYRLHKIKKIFLLNHTDCGAYSGSEPFFSLKEEISRHIEDLKEARDLLIDHYQEIKVVLILIQLEAERIDFKIID